MVMKEPPFIEHYASPALKKKVLWKKLITPYASRQDFFLYFQEKPTFMIIYVYLQHAGTIT